MPPSYPKQLCHTSDHVSEVLWLGSSLGYPEVVKGINVYAWKLVLSSFLCALWTLDFSTSAWYICYISSMIMLNPVKHQLSNKPVYSHIQCFTLWLGARSPHFPHYVTFLHQRQAFVASYLYVSSYVLSNESFLCTLYCSPQSHTCECDVSLSLGTPIFADVLYPRYWKGNLNWKKDTMITGWIHQNWWFIASINTHVQNGTLPMAFTPGNIRNVMRVICVLIASSQPPYQPPVLITCTLCSMKLNV